MECGSRAAVCLRGLHNEAVRSRRERLPCVDMTDRVPPVPAPDGIPFVPAVLALLTLLIHFGTSGRYGYFRDELYYIACGNHLAWGYVDHAPLIAAVAAGAHVLFGDSLFGARFFPALAHGGTVLCTGAI